MKTRGVVYSRTARADMIAIFRWLAEEATVLSAIAIVDDLEQFIDRLDVASERGTRRDDLVPGLRIIPHKRAQVAVYVENDTVMVARVFYGGQDWESLLRP
jgi:toxin ParE1/3/4